MHLLTGLTVWLCLFAVLASFCEIAFGKSPSALYHSRAADATGPVGVKSGPELATETLVHVSTILTAAFVLYKTFWERE